MTGLGNSLIINQTQWESVLNSNYNPLMKSFFFKLLLTFSSIVPTTTFRARDDHTTLVQVVLR